MEEHLFIVLWRDTRGIWHAEGNGVFTERRLAENFVECKKAAGETFKFAVVEGSILRPETMAEASARLGEF